MASKVEIKQWLYLATIKSIFMAFWWQKVSEISLDISNIPV